MPSPAPDRRRAGGPPPRRRVSRRRYVLRRIMVVAVLALVVVGAVRLVTALGGSERESVAEASDQPVASDDQPSAPAGEGAGVPTSDGTAGQVGAGQAEPMSSVAGTTAPEPTGPPTPESPARVLIVGDSDAGTFGPYLQQLLDETGVVETTLDYKVSSGLARPDFFDWPAELQRVVPATDPDIVVVTFGGNDAQGLATSDGEFIVSEPSPDRDNDEWRAEYGRRAGEVMDLLMQDGRTVIWVGIPNDDNPDVTFRMQVQDETVKAEAAERPGLRFVDTWTRFAGRNGGWAEYVVDPRDGKGKDVRADDGFHLNETGAEILALDIAALIRDDLVARGASL